MRLVSVLALDRFGDYGADQVTSLPMIFVMVVDRIGCSFAALDMPYTDVFISFGLSVC